MFGQFWPPDPLSGCVQGGRRVFRLPAVGGRVHGECVGQFVRSQRVQVLYGGQEQRRGSQVLPLCTGLWRWLVVLQVSNVFPESPFNIFLLLAASSPTWTGSTSWLGRTTATTGGSSGSSGWATTLSSPLWWWSDQGSSPLPPPPFQLFQHQIPSSQPRGWPEAPPWMLSQTPPPSTWTWAWLQKMAPWAWQPSLSPIHTSSPSSSSP